MIITSRGDSTISTNTAHSCDRSALVRNLCDNVPLLPRLPFEPFLQDLRIARLVLRREPSDSALEWNLVDRGCIETDE